MKKYFVRIRTKNKSANPLRKSMRMPFRSVVRLGSTTPNEIIFKPGQRFKEINSAESIQNSRSKLRMKKCFADAEVPQAEWYKYIFANNEHRFQDQLNEEEHIYYTDNLPYPILAKRVYGFKGRGMSLINNQEELESWLENHPNINGWYFEEFKNYSREYRLHCTQDECFMAWRKLRRNDSSIRWYFNSDNCNWVGEAHELFDRPSNWDNIIENCKKALKAIKLDIGSFDVRIQSSNKEIPEYILVEVNSAPSLGEQGVEIYKNIIPKILNNKNLIGL